MQVFPDGSCEFSGDEVLAHAGYGLSFGGLPQSPKDFGPVKSSAQTSYRCDLRGIAQALARCKVPVVIYCDCLSIVNQLNTYMDEKITQIDCPASELWRFIEAAIDIRETGDLVIRWTPSHLDDAGNEEKRRKYLSNGVTNLACIAANARADELAAAGVRSHGIPAIDLLLAHDRSQLSRIIQNHIIQDRL